jgi:hypothetical protein
MLRIQDSSFQSVTSPGHRRKFTFGAHRAGTVVPGIFKLAINSLVVASLTLGAVFLFANLPQSTLEPLQWAGRHFTRPAALALWFLYTMMIWAVLGALVAWAMLLLKPRTVALYGFVSAATFIAMSQSWSLVQPGNTSVYVRELVFVLTIPTWYWLFARMARTRDHPSSDPDAGHAGLGRNHNGS